VSINYAEAYRLIQRGRRSERRAAALGKFVQGIIVSAMLTFLKGWLFMLAVGVAHAHWWHTIPTIGFWWAVLFMAVMPSLGSTSSKSNDD
jgi:hypothetical protein